MLTLVADDQATLSPREKIVLGELQAFYNTEAGPQAFQDLATIKQAGTISFRLIDYTCTNYSKVKNTRFRFLSEKNKHESIINVHQEYLKKASFFHKPLFDCFGRKAVSKPITVCVAGNGDDKTHIGHMSTTLAQLHFFSFLHNLRILTFIREHKTDIETHMSQAYKKRNEQRKQGGKKRKRLNVPNGAATRQVSLAHVQSLTQL